MRKSRWAPQAGFSLLELIVAAAVMGVIVSVIITAIFGIQNLNHKTKNLTIATQVVQQQEEVYRNTPYNSIPVGTVDLISQLSPYPSLHTPRSATATITEIQAGSLKKVVINVAYTEAGSTKNIAVATLIASRGINK